MTKWEDILKANQETKTTDIKGKDYVEVNQRVKAFRMVHPNGSIRTEIISIDNGVVVMKATICDGDGMLLANGMAYEKESSSFINKTSYIENCETSAVGRALGFCGFGIDSSIASYEEVANAIENQKEKKEEKPTQKAKAKPKTKAKAKEATDAVSDKRVDLTKVINQRIAEMDSLGIDFREKYLVQVLKIAKVNTLDYTTLSDEDTERLINTYTLLIKEFRNQKGV